MRRGVKLDDSGARFGIPHVWLQSDGQKSFRYHSHYKGNRVWMKGIVPCNLEAVDAVSTAKAHHIATWGDVTHGNHECIHVT
jgi:hypothetical protein